MSILIINCDQQGNIFTGVSECGKYDTGDFLKALPVRKRTTFPNSTAFLEAFKDELQKNNVLPLTAYDYRNNHEENQINTSSIGNMQLQRLGKPMFEVDITNSICEMKAISKINNTSQSWDLILLFENAIVMAQNADGTLSGFDCNLIHTESTKLKQGGDLQMKTLKAQLRSSAQYNERMTLVPITEALAEIKELQGIQELAVDLTVSSGTELEIVVTDKCSGNPKEGLTASANYQLTGVQSSATSIGGVVSNGDGSYTLTITPTLVDGDTIGVKVAESGTQSVLIDGEYFGGSSAIVNFAEISV